MSFNSSQVGKDSLLADLMAKFAESDACWFGSVRPDGRAHLAPIWHILYEDRIYVVTGSKSVRARNIRSNPQVSLSLPDPMTVFIVEGVARPAPEREQALQPLFLAKYAWDISSDAGYDLIIEVRPSKAMAWGEHGEGRWRFESDDLA